MRASYKITLVFIFSLITFALASQTVTWLTWEEAMERSQVEKKKMIVDIYTDWCTWCKKMDQTSFSDSVVVNYLNENYYAIKLDAQSEEPINYNSKVYEYENRIWNGGYHQLALELMGNKMKLPTVVFLDENGQVIQSIGGFRTATELELMTAYFNGNYHHSTPWKSFVSMYQNQKTTDEVFKQKMSAQSHTRLVNQKN